VLSTTSEDSFDDDLDDGSCVALYDFVGQSVYVLLQCSNFWMLRQSFYSLGTDTFVCLLDCFASVESIIFITIVTDDFVA